jgi:phosphatidylglycerophosphatase A
MRTRRPNPMRDDLLAALVALVAMAGWGLVLALAVQ